MFQVINLERLQQSLHMPKQREHYVLSQELFRAQWCETLILMAFIKVATRYHNTKCWSFALV